MEQKKVSTGILDRIGNTLRTALRHNAPSNGSRIVLKQESENPSGS
jgi:cysteine synthase A